MKNIEYMGTSIKCDNEGCDWSEKIKSPEEFEIYVDQLCPKCQGPKVLITEKDVIAFHATLELVNMIAVDVPEGTKGSREHCLVLFKDGQVKEMIPGVKRCRSCGYILGPGAVSANCCERPDYPEVSS
jgi:hypothetical protein